MTEPRLTDAELDAEIKIHADNGCVDGKWRCTQWAMVAELCSLREAVRQDATDAATVVALYAERDALREREASLLAQRQELLSDLERALGDLEDSREQNAKLMAALVRAHEWMVSTYDYESLSPAGTAILKDEMLAAKLAIDGFCGLASVKGEQE